ncbi:MAG TPA: AraC family transcriptional regulator [Nitrospira sp.]|jgi:AraC-like DNA-binding protein|nr:helix-turn-helix transcriptional regulator [Nitrospira sp.]MBS0172734.1 helix-turn-helix transcriptional regulator [Nitrospira sp.]MBS0179070.1 helix-turn-helix transcriptional regulator [Nitrospira sp.]MBX3338409.1 helix-turn-helix transcriptional regulator [Nitrospira sp.]MCW5781500.1 helix-turn-helix transcriptional regulator [Nitrospira sp.]
MSAKPSHLPFSIDRLHTLASELRSQSPEWADRLEHVKTEHELRDLVCELFNLSHTLISHEESPPTVHTLPTRIATFIRDNLHQGMSLKVLANFLGYSEKYCSDLFARIMGEPFSTYLRRYRVERGSTLLRSSGQTLAEIAASLGFSDQFAFSHFFKRATGQSPLELRMLHIRRHARQEHRSLRYSPSNNSA